MPMASTSGSSRRRRGSIQVRPNGALRVRVYTGYDPVTGERHYLNETVQPGPKARAEAEKVRTRLLNQVDERRNPKTSSTMNQLMDRYLDVVDVDESTEKTYRGYIKNHIRPVLGALPVSKVDGEVLDSFYGQLRRCRSRCAGRGGLIDHRTASEHECNDRCRPHVCRPLAASTVRQIHWILSGAFDRAVRWNWISMTPSGSAQPPAPPRPDPSPPNAEEAARIVIEAWKDAEWGAFIWVVMTTGARRGEACAIRRSGFLPGSQTLWIPRSVSGTRQVMREKDTKTHQRRKVGLDAETVLVIQELIELQDKRAEELGIRIADDAYLFSLDPDCRRPLVPDSVTQLYDRMAGRLGIETTLHKLRHYNATELLTAGVDLRTSPGAWGTGEEGRPRCAYMRRGSTRPGSSPRRNWPGACRRDPSPRCSSTRRRVRFPRRRRRARVSLK
jgi:integrase